MHAPTHFNPHSRARRLLLGATLLAVALAVALLTGAPGSAATKTQLGDVRANQDDVSAELDRQNAAIDAILAEAGQLRAREDKVAAQLADEEAKLADARSQLTKAQDTLEQTKRQLKVARTSLSKLLVSIYQNPTIDETAVLLDSDGFDDLTTRSEYLQMINAHETGIAERFHDLRVKRTAQVEAAKDAVGRIEKAKSAIEARRDSLAASQADLDARKGDLRAARAAQREQLAKLAGKENDLIKALSTPAPETETPATPDETGGSTGTGAPAEPPAAPVAPPSGSQATINSDGTATAPANAPPAVKAVIAAGNEIANTPYVYGGGHGSFESSGYDCSGSISYALHGGGFLSAPLDSTGFMGWGEAGPGSWITVYANAGHAYMEVAGLRYDTSGAPPRWQTGPPYPAGFVVRHPSGY